MNFTSTPESPASFPGSSSNGGRKRVEFSPWTNGPTPTLPSRSPSTTSTVKPLPPSSECQPSLKSILKTTAFDGLSLPNPAVVPEEELSMSAMMESIVQQLASDERTISVDAYQILAKVIRQYDDIPDEAVLKSKVSAILRYIKRDLLRPMDEIADTSLITQALKVLVIFVWNPEYSSFLNDEYRTFILDRSISIISEHTAPKSVIIHYLHLLATQNFRPILLTSNNRVLRLLESLKALSEHIKGIGVTLERILVYKKLLEQSKLTMKAKANLWIEELLTGMTNSCKEVRVKAIDFGVQVCAAFPSSPSISGPTRNVLERELENNVSFGAAICRRLEKMVASKDDMSQVPQIWSTIVLLSNSMDTRIDSWADLKIWLKVIQKCFNGSDPLVRQQSNLAWNRLVYVARPHEASDTLLAMLAKPVTIQLERPTADKTVKGSRMTAVGSYCNLLYYAFRPASTHKQYTRIWNEYIVKVMRSSFFERNSANSDIACRIFIALLWNSSQGPKVWNENRSLQDSRMIEPEEIPTLDCKWVRAKCSAIVDMFQILLRYSSWGASGQSDKAYIAVAWTHFLRALKDAGSKEIKPSAETKHAANTVLEFLERIWHEAAQGSSEVDVQVAAQIKQMTRMSVMELGQHILSMTLETNGHSLRLPFIFSEVTGAIIAEMSQQHDNGEARLHPSNNRISMQSLRPQYEKCLDFMCESIIKDISEESVCNLMEDFKTLDLLLQTTSPELLRATISRLQKPLALMLKTGYEVLQQKSIIESDQLYETFGRSITTALGKLPCNDVEAMDDVFSSLFTGSSTVLVNQAIVMWNSTFAHQETITLGTGLRQALSELHKLTDVYYPGMPEQQTSQHLLDVSSPLEYAETPSPPSHRSARTYQPPPNGLGVASPELGSQALTNNRIYSDDHQTYIPSSPGQVKSISEPTPRHDDSQVLFVPIESSPTSVLGLESQYLTVHQKDVRDRQRSEPAVVFPDLRSSPHPQSKSQHHGDCEFARKAASLGECPSTPTLPTNQDHGEREIQASPTPRARHYTNHVMDIEVPSSPPSVHDGDTKGRTGLENLSSPPQGPVDDSQMILEIGMPASDALDQNDDEMDAAVDAVPTPSVVDTPLQEAIATLTPGPERDLAEADAEDGETEEDSNVVGSMAVIVTKEIIINERTSPVATSRSDSDENDVLSASQLSQDLDRHIYESTGSSLLEQAFETAPTSSSNDGCDQECSNNTTHNFRKRKAGNSGKPARKRRIKSTSQLSSQASGEGYSSSQNELLDTIEVISSPSDRNIMPENPVSERRSCTSESTPTQRRGRGRPRKRGRGLQSADCRQTPQIVAAVIVPRPSALKTENSDFDTLGVDAGLTEHVESGELVIVDMELMPTEEESTENAIQELDDATSVPVVATSNSNQESSEQADPTFLTTLQAALDQLKSNTTENIDLRAVDDLCFQIRFHAQVLSQK
ncbi:hypothetical protein LTR84_009330 [Exophiala bonariae]|uniref:Telomere-associated protein Rif1 N-terminal domain-containing protein n=1 Tax=Exophiala bonariae TaxID=1690606 RepID=A0AAV9MUZ0_9EURO|nr:hypothetical protein LTR84_009330 [Exophiala bonariae]